MRSCRLFSSALTMLIIVSVSFVNVKAENPKGGRDKVRREKNFSISSEEAEKMLKEAEDFIDEVSDGRQDRQCDAILHSMGGGGELTAVRKNYESGVSQLQEGSKMQEIPSSDQTGGISLRLYLPGSSGSGKLPTLVYLHGGGWCLGGFDSCEKFCSSLAATGEVAVLAVDYSKAPENPFPKALNEIIKVIDYAISHASDWGSKPTLVSVGGDGAGGNLALASVLAMGEEKSRLKSIVLFYPIVKAWVDKTDSWKRWNRGYGLDSRLLEAYFDAYIGKEDCHSSRLSPIEATPSQLRGLPPVMFISAERDILYDQGKEFVEKVKMTDGNIRHIVFPGTVHGFISVSGQPSAGIKAVEITSEFLTQ